MPAIKIVTEDDNSQEFTADSFLEYIRVSNDRWHTPHPTCTDHNNFPMYIAEGGWVFRGQWNAEEWTLTPSSWRQTPRMLELHQKQWDDGLKNGLREDQMSKGNNWLNMEASILRAFQESLNEFGHPLPDLADLETFYRKTNSTSRVEITGLAQHHGIPTSFLDWTFNPLSAAYFSTGKQFRMGESENICIWACRLSSPLIGDAPPTNVDETATDCSAYKIQVHKQPNASNEYLRAQQGLFLEMGPATSVYFDEYDKWPDLETVAEELFGRLPADLQEICDGTFRKVILKSSEADRLLQLLHREGFNRSALMPTLDNLAADTIEKWESI